MPLLFLSACMTAGDPGPSGSASPGLASAATLYALPTDTLAEAGLTVGDLGGDGLADIALGVLSFSDTNDDHGRAVLLLDSRAPLDPGTAATVHGNDHTPGWGAMVALPGDLDGDGDGEVALLLGDGCLGAERGAALLYGPFDTETPADCPLDDAEAATFAFPPSDTSTTWADRTITPLSDGDGPATLAVGGGGEGADVPGLVALYDTPVRGVQLLSDAPTVLTGAHPGDRFGFNVARADVLGDGSRQLLVGASFDPTYTDAGGTIRIFTDPNGNVAAVDADAVVTAPAGSHIGDGLVAGDLDDDGYDDLVTGTFAEAALDQKGVWYLASGPIAGERDLTEGLLIDSGYDTVRGYGPVTAVADFDADGRLDLAIRQIDHGEEGGGLLIRFGPLTGGAEQLYAESGTDDESGVAAGDVDGDGLTDLVFTFANWPTVTGDTLSGVGVIDGATIGGG